MREVTSVLAERVESLVASGIASWLELVQCRQLDALLLRFPWSGTHLAWEKIEHSMHLACGSLGDGAIVGFVSRLAAVQCETVCVLLSRDLGFRVRTSWFLHNLDAAACNSQQFFAFASLDAADAAKSVAEFEPGSMIWGMLPNNALQATRGDARD